MRCYLKIIRHLRSFCTGLIPYFFCIPEVLSDITGGVFMEEKLSANRDFRNL